jgi:hypothetical protein
VCLPLFALFGPKAEVVRLLDVLYAAIGVIGIATLLGRHVSYPAAAAVAWAIAINPSYLDLTVFDNNACAPWMAALGFVCLGISRYIEKQDHRSAFLLGVALGFGVWSRTNFLWLLVAFAIALVLATGFRHVPRHWAAVLAGGFLGGLPLLAYEINSRGGTWASMDLLSTPASQQRFFGRVVMFAETLLSDREHRAIWSGPALPEWQRWLFPCVVLASCATCLTLGGKWARTFALALLTLASIFLLTDLPIAEHHLLAMIPVAIVVVMMAGVAIETRYRWSRPILVAFAAVYLGSGLYWQFATLAGLRRTGGVGPWSDAVYTLTKRLITDYPNSQLKIVDWGLQNNLYVLSDGKLHSREIFWEASAENSAPKRAWTDEIREGGVFLLNGQKNRQFPNPTRGFLAAVRASRVGFKHITVFQRSGEVYAEIFEIPPNE